jgi:DNA-binding transcriptional LysR family regulator
LRVRARLRDFDAICQMVAAGVGIAVMPEAAARRCARSMPISLLAIRDAWANRQLAICARSFKSLAKPARLLVEHLRKAARWEISHFSVVTPASLITLAHRSISLPMKP